MDRQEVKRCINKIYEAYQSIPVSSIRNAVTYEEYLQTRDDWKKNGHSDVLPIPSHMLPHRNSEKNVAYVGFYPVYFYDTDSIGIAAAYYSSSELKTMTFGPYRTAEEFYDEFIKYEGIGTYDFICNYLKTDTAFMMTYDEAYRSLQVILDNKGWKNQKLPMMRVFNVEGSFMGSSVEVITEVILNPYCYSEPMVKCIVINESTKTVLTRISSLENLEGFVEYDKEVVKKAVEKIKKTIDENRHQEDALMREVCSLGDDRKGMATDDNYSQYSMFIERESCNMPSERNKTRMPIEKYMKLINEGIKAAEEDPEDNIHRIREDIRRDGGKYVKFYKNDDFCLLFGASTTTFDYYWDVCEPTGELRFVSCAIAYEVLNDEEEYQCWEKFRDNGFYHREQIGNHIKDEMKKKPEEVMITDFHYLVNNE